MSPRAAWRLETLGFQEVYDYVAGKADWAAAGLPREGTSTLEPAAGDAADGNVPTCTLGERLALVRERVREAGWDTCIVVNEERIVLGRLRRAALAADDDRTVEQAMDEGPGTIRPNVPLEAIVRRLQERNLTTTIVTTSDGRLVGVLRREEAEARLPQHPT